MDIQTSADRRNKKATAGTKNLFGWHDWPPSDSETYPGGPGWKEPRTSRDAARKIAPHAKTVRATVLHCVATQFPRSFTTDQIAAELGLSVLSVRPRVTELQEAALFERVPERIKNENTGMTSGCWRATRDAVAEIANA